MRTLRMLARGTVAAASMLVIDAHAADLSSFSWPWSQPDAYWDIPSYDWSGGYVAIMGGYNSSNITHGDLAANMVDRALPAWKYAEQAKTLAKALSNDMTANAGVYSVQAGFNIMSQRLVYGAEIEYGKFSPSMNAASAFDESREVDQKTWTDSTDKVVIDYISVRTAYTNKTQINDFGLINARAGYAYGRFMPYALVGFGVTRVKLATTMKAEEAHRIEIDGVYSKPPSYVISPPTAVLTKNAYAATVSLGLGFEYALLDNVILRAQYNYMTSGSIKGEGLSNNMARGGLALKF